MPVNFCDFWNALSVFKMADQCRDLLALELVPTAVVVSVGLCWFLLAAHSFASQLFLGSIHWIWEDRRRGIKLPPISPRSPILNSPSPKTKRLSRTHRQRPVRRRAHMTNTRCHLTHTWHWLTARPASTEVCKRRQSLHNYSPLSGFWHYHIYFPARKNSRLKNLCVLLCLLSHFLLFYFEDEKRYGCAKFPSVELYPENSTHLVDHSAHPSSEQVCLALSLF